MFNHLYLYNPDNGVRCDSPTIQAAVDQFRDISGFKVVGKDKSLEANMQVALQKVKNGEAFSISHKLRLVRDRA